MEDKNDSFSNLEQFEVCTSIGCKNMCSYCPQHTIISAYKSPIKMMSLQTFKKCVDQIPKHVRIVFAGMSEPFLNKSCIKMVEYAYKKGHKIDIFTTGIGIKNKDISLLREISFNSFELHLPDDKNLTSIKVDGYYVNIIKQLKEANLKNFGYKLFGKIHPGLEKVLGPKLEDLSRILHNRAGNLTSIRGEYLEGMIACRYAGKFLNNNILLPNGDITLCDMDYGLKYIFGNLLKTPYKELLNSDKFKKFKKAIESRNDEILCRHCAYARKMENPLDKLKAKWDDSNLKVKLFKIYKKIFLR